MKWKTHRILICLSALFLALFVQLFCTTQSVSAQSISRALALQRSYRFSPDDVWTTNVIGPANLPFNIISGGSGYFGVRGINFSGSVPNQQSGVSYTGTATVKLRHTGPLTSGFGWYCDAIASVYARPEQGSIVSQHNEVQGCTISNGGHDMEIKIFSYGNFNTTTTVSSFVISIYDNENGLGIITNYSSAAYTVQLYSADVNIVVSQDPNTALLGEVNNNVNNINVNLEQNQQQDQQDRDNVQNTSNNAQQSGNNAGQAATQKGQTLMQAFSSLITAITNIHATDCNLPNFAIYGLQFNNMNMCLFEMPSAIMTLASIGMVFIIVPLGINLVKRMIALYNEIIGGK